MRIFPVLITLVSILASNLVPFLPQPAPGMPAWQDQVDPWVLETAARGETEFLVALKEQADLSGAAGLTTQAAKGKYVYEQLSQTAQRSQAPILHRLAAAGVDYRAYWISNLIWVRGDASILQELALLPEVAHVYANPWVQVDLPPNHPANEIEEVAGITALEWNIARVHADDVWAAGYTGQGVVIGGQDTGYQWDHPALINQYRGWDGAVADHLYNWHDAIHDDNPYSGGANDCGFNTETPCDDHGHGTHTMGTMVGDDGAGNQIGMAPGARWIGCRNMENGWGTPQTYIECYQWFVAPTDFDNQNPRPDLAPQVINNSWSCPVDEGCTDPLVLQEVVRNVRAAGILTVHSAGNSGPACGTVNTPAAIYTESFTVGNTRSDDTISASSSRGPVLVDGSGRMKPDISAPGSDIRSSYVGGGYARLSGTSMAAPHVAGLVALMLSAHPELSGQVELVEQIIQETAVPLATTTPCGDDIAGVSVPNNTYGWGRIDAQQAYDYHRFDISTTVSIPFVAPGDTLTFTLALDHLGATELTTVRLVNELPEGVRFLNASDDGYLDGSNVVWDLGSLSFAETRQVQFSVIAEQIGTITNANFYATSDQINSSNGPPVLVLVADSIIFLPLSTYLSP